MNATTSLVTTAFVPVATNIISEPPVNFYTGLPWPVDPALFFQIELE